MSPSQQAQPLFDSSRAALRFALRYSKNSTTAPLMSKMLAEIKKDSYPEKPSEMAARVHSTLKNFLKGLDAAGQAGVILISYAKLTTYQRLVLLGKTIDATLPCDCSSPCCSGSRFNPEWQECVEALCTYLMAEAELSKQHGKKGMSMHPVVRAESVRKYLDHSRRFSNDELAERCDLSVRTVIEHKKVIFASLEDQEKDGWTALDALLVENGIVGALT